MHVDRWGNLIERPAFLAAVGDKDRSLWRIALVILLGALAFVVATIVAMALVIVVYVVAVHGSPEALTQARWPAGDLTPFTYIAAMAGLGLFGGAAAFAAIAARIAGRPVMSLITSARQFRWRAVGAGLAVYLPILAAGVGISFLWSPPTGPGPVFLPGAAIPDVVVYALATSAFLFLAALAEEIFFRGWLAQQIAAFTRNLPLILIASSLLFSLAHFDPNPDAFLERAAIGAALAWITIRTGGVELAAGAHLANNLLISLFIEPVTLASVEPHAFDMSGVVVDAVCLGALVAAVELILRRPGWARALGLQAPLRERPEQAFD